MLFLLLVLAPFGTGLLMNRFIESKQRSVGMAYVSGFLIMLAAFQLIAVPIYHKLLIQVRFTTIQTITGLLSAHTMPTPKL